ncbi:monodehydroascorbate reductase [Tanacetum coccineum]
MYVCPGVGSTCADIMADLNIPANDAPMEQAPAVAPPTRTNDQILPLSKWVPIGKSNCVLDVHKPQRNPIFPIGVALLKNTNFFRAFMASSTISAIYIQQFWDTMCFNSSNGLYSCQLDEQWFNLHKDILKDALNITPASKQKYHFLWEVQLIASVLSTMQQYWASVYMLPDTVIKSLKKLFKRFLWNVEDSAKGKARVAWSLSNDAVKWVDNSDKKESYSTKVVWISLRDNWPIGKLLTQDRMVWIQGNDLTCVLCNKCRDNHEHLFFKCSWAKEVWLKISEKGRFTGVECKLSKVVGHLKEGTVKRNIWQGCCYGFLVKWAGNVASYGIAPSLLMNGCYSQEPMVFGDIKVKFEVDILSIFSLLVGTTIRDKKEEIKRNTNDSNPFIALPFSDTVIEYVNTLGYPSTLKNVSAMSVNALYQPWRAILSMIKCAPYIAKTAGLTEPRHPTFLTDMKNLATVARGKKKTAHLLIPSVRFTKLIIHHLRTKHNIHPRTGSPLHYSYEESILNTLRFVGKDGREIFGMPIPDALLTNNIKGAPYYGDYQEHVAKYQQFLDEERGKAMKGGAIESSEATEVTKPKTTKATKPAGDKAPKPTATQPPIPKPAPTQPSKVVSGKKRKMVKETPNEPSPVKRSKGGLVTKRRKPKSPLKVVDEPSDEGVPVEEPTYNEEDVDLERALELSLMEQRAQTQGPARPVVIREPESGRIQPLLEVQGKGKEKVASKINAGSQDEGQAGPNPGEQDEGQAGPNPGTLDEGQAGSNPGDTAGSQPPPSYVVHAGPNLEHMDLETTDASTQHKPKQIDEGFTTTAYPNV